MKYKICGDEITIFAKNYAKIVEILSDEDIILSDNYFNIYDGKKTIKILSDKCKKIKLRSVYNIK